MGIRETTLEQAETGANGGTAGPIEWVGAAELATDVNGNQSPIGKLIKSRVGEWQDIEFDLEKEPVIAFSPDADGVLDGLFGVLEHFAFTVVPEATGAAGPFDIFIDKIEQVDDVLVAGTSQGIQISRDFGTRWGVTRLVETPVHKFHRATNNRFLWAIAANEVLIAEDPANWFATTGLTGVQYIRDIVEDDFGNMFISTEKGVYWFEIALIRNFSSWRQTQPVTAFTTDCYGLYHNSLSSGDDEIWVSTEIGIYKTIDNGDTWTDTGMKTQGLPAFEFMNISDTASPNIIAITRKHVLRELGAESEFSVIANLEVQHNIFDIWKMEHFAGRLYVSTGSGVYSNSLDELEVPNVTIPFERVFPGLDFNGNVGVAFGIDSVQIDETTNQLFLGQENRLMMADEQNVLSIKEQYPNRELPSFFADNTELKIGFIYNAFNNVVIFREPQPVNTVYRAVHLPRKNYIPINGGWAQTNPEADVFIFINGIPKWLDFKLNETNILSEMEAVEQKLDGLGILTTFNSLQPDATNRLALVQQDIVTLREGGTDGIALVNNQTITQFFEDHTRFVSLIGSAIVTANELDVFPKINLAGFPESQRETNSRAELLEEKEDFTANDSTGINIDTFSGKVDFQTVFTTTINLADKQEFVFDKFDILEISVFHANVSGTGEFRHRELEDRMEAVNTGLTSDLAKTHYGNLIKAGIFLEGRHNFMFDGIDAMNIQSKYNGAHTNTWYDIVNSTVDYDLILSVANNPESKLANWIQTFSENPYLLDRVWIGTDSDIIQYEFIENTGDLVTENIIRPGGSASVFVWDIFVLSEDDIYVVAEEKDTKVGHIFRTVDAGVTWTDLETINLPQQIHAFAIINGNKVALTSKGIFYSDNSLGTWFPSVFTLSPQLSDSSPAVTSFTQRIRNKALDTFMIAESDRWFFTSGGGIDWFILGGRANRNNISVISKIVRFKSLTWIATDKGLYADGNSILSDSVSFGLQNLEDTEDLSVAVEVTDIVAGSADLYCSSGSGKIYRFRNNEWKSYQFPDLSTIHKIAVIETTNSFDGVRLDYMIVVSHNVIKVIDISIGLFT